MISDPASILIFSLVVVAIHIVILILMQETGRPFVLMISAATCVFCLQQAVSAYQMRQVGLLVQALGSGGFFGCFLFRLILQMLHGPASQRNPSR